MTCKITSEYLKGVSEKDQEHRSADMTFHMCSVMCKSIQRIFCRGFIVALTINRGDQILMFC